jgi:glycosyltransferase involved in cell wall biosynthesis
LVHAGIPIVSLGKSSRWDIASAAVKFLRIIHKTRPAIIYSYLTTANLLALLAKLYSPSIKLVWGIRASNVDFARYDWFTRFSFRAECLLSRFPDLIIANSFAGSHFHCEKGFFPETITVIHNGVDTGHFEPDRQAGEKVRREWQIEDEELLIGHVGRLDPMKDHPTFFRAAAIIAEKRKAIRFVCVGEGPHGYQEELKSFAQECGVASQLLWAGPRQDMRAVYNACNVIVSSSAWGEGFSNVLAEAMACGVPCVGTNVGDTPHVLSDGSGIIVPARNPEALANGINYILDYKNLFLPNEIRKRISEDFNQNQMVEQTEHILVRHVCKQ